MARLRSNVHEKRNAKGIYLADADSEITGNSRKPIAILCLITGLEYGGAEMMLYKFLSRMDKTRFTAQVISMIDLGPFSGRIQELGVPLLSLGMRREVRIRLASYGLFVGFAKTDLTSYKRGCTTPTSWVASQPSWREAYRLHGTFDTQNLLLTTTD